MAHLAPFGYEPDPYFPNFWTHKTRRTKFCLCVNDFGIKYYSQDDANHLIQALRTAYKITIDMKGKQYCGLDLNWQYDKGYVDVSMNKFVTTTLDKLQHKQSSRPQHAPHDWVKPTYSTKPQLAHNEDDSPKLNTQETNKIQSIVGSFLYYGRAVDPTIFPAVNELGITQAAPTQNTATKAKRLCDYLHTHSHATLRYHASDMCLHIDSDAAYLAAPQSKSRVAGFFYLSDHPSKC